MISVTACSANASSNNEVLAREGIDTYCCGIAKYVCIVYSNNEVLAREGIDTLNQLEV